MSRKSSANGCGHKRAYATKAGALEETASKERQLRPYECEVCGKWHLTSMNLTYWLVARKKAVRAAAALAPLPTTEEQKQ